MVATDGIGELKSDIAGLKRKLDTAGGRRDEVEKVLLDEKSKRDEIASNRELYLQASAFLAVVMDDTQKRMEGIFGEIGTAALEKIFGDGCSLSVKFKKERGSVKVVIKVKQPICENDEGEVEFLETDILHGDGGAVVDIVAFTLRVAMLELYSPKQEGPLLLDETLRFIASDERMHLSGEFLREVAEKTQRQLILITHEKTLLPYADEVFEFSLHPGKRVKIETTNGRSGDGDPEGESQDGESQ